MEYSCIGLSDLPAEILMIIFKKLNNLDVLYSLQGVNQRLNHIIYDPIFTSRLTFVKRLLHNFIDVFHCNMVLNRFCLQILPEIGHQIKWLDLESSSMKYILHAAHFPNLHTLGLYNINQESAQCLFTDEILSSGIFKDQITTLILTIDNNNNSDDYEEMLLIVRSFPFMEELTVINRKPQNRKQSYELNNTNRNSSIIAYSFLSELDLLNVHDDYIEEFLFNTKSYFQNILLRIECESLQRVTQNFTRDATRINCTKINELELSGEPLCSDSLQQYFPHARINYDLVI
ncbi:unnamed protein product [Rotaria sordida]|uniref:F-box domain-containing protein n=1 Tax=Rotaria sordida TaxID=392033 RepID=A0A814JTC4_9BILA|nr:unnamed protein product [Rotaria sordida]